MKARPLSLLCLLLLAAAVPTRAQSLYWEEPRELVPSGVRFPVAVSGGGLVAVIWQEIVPRAGGGGDIYLSLQSSRDMRSWRRNTRFIGPLSYQGREVSIFSAAADSRGNLYLAVTTNGSVTRILRSSDGGASFELLSEATAGGASLAPSISFSSGGNIILFVTQERGAFLSTSYAVSPDGRSWSAFRPLVAGEQLPMNFLPSHTSLDGREYLVFQAWAGSGQVVYQLYFTSSDDGGYTWKAPLKLAESISGEGLGEVAYTHQRPHLAAVNSGLGLAWERQQGSSPPQIYFAGIASDGTITGEAEVVNSGKAPAHFPRLLGIRNQILVFWFDSSRGKEGENHIFFAEKRGVRWEERDLSNISGSSVFAYPVELKEQLYLFWENRIGNRSRLMFLEPDQSVSSPVLRAVDFDPRLPARRDTVRVGWALPPDPSGIAGVDYLWSRNPEGRLAGKLRLLTDVNSLELAAEQDGTWYFSLAAQDYAGNWSVPARVSFTRDATPPPVPSLISPAPDEQGYLSSNTFSLSWQVPEGSEAVSGYTYSLDYLGSAEAEQPVFSPRLAPRVLSTDTAVSYVNRDDGWWAFSVAALDAAGNLSETATVLLRLNKYVPVTYISSLSSQTDPAGGLTLSIVGRGFSVGGLVSEVLLDLDGKAPYDYTFAGSQGQYSVASDRLIRGLNLVDIEEGQYRVGVVHPSRGLAFSAGTLRIESPGTVKFGDFSFIYQRSWQSARRVAYFIGANKLAVWLVVAFLALLFVVSVRRLAGIMQDGRLLRRDVLAVLRGEEAAFRKELRMEELKRRGVGLRLKFTLLIMILVLITVLMVSVPLGYFIIDRQMRTLVQGLTQRVDVLIGSAASSAAKYLAPVEKDTATRIDLGQLPGQIDAMEEAVFMTVTGAGVEDPDNFDYVWATNDPEIDGKVQGGAFGQDRLGELRLEDDLVPVIAELEQSINSAARQKVSDLVEDISRLSAEASRLALSAATDPQAAARLGSVQQQILDLEIPILAGLREVGSVTGSKPAFSPENLLPFYTFFRPVVFRRGTEDIYFRGAIRLGISTERIQAELAASQRNLIIRTGIIALIAAGLGLLGAVMMASITINPIKKLAMGVAVIRDTDDKERLRAHVIDVRSKDEIGMLAATVNQMTQGLVKAAIASKDLTVGKEIQKMFIPLAPLAADPAKGKGTTGGAQDDKIEIFGFYEGAKGVSGDYFDFRRLTDKYYAVIKCDVSGKGVPAALIMVEVATIFSTFFRNWTPQDPGLKIDQLAYLINDMLEERGFKGRFAALTLAIVNTETGKSYFVNAGDTKLHIYRAAAGKMVEHKLPDAPAAGVFPSELVQLQAGFKIVSQELEPGDTVFLFTDGIEDAKRLFRDEHFQTMVCAEPGLEENQEHGNHTKGSDNEVLGIDRIYEILNAVFNRGVFHLVKHHNPVPGEELTFDFSRCRGTVEEAVLAMVAIEKVFRLYPDPSATGKDRITVDRNIDGFLKEHFSQYDRYFSAPLPAEEPSELLTFGRLKEDEQYDDLTILAIRKK